MASRIDFKWIKEQSDVLTVRAHYGIKVFGKGTSRSIHCPFHQDKEPSCKINLGRKGYHCFGCDAHGNILTLTAKLEGLDEDELRAAARKLAEICNLPLVPPSGHCAKPQKPDQGEELAAETMLKPSSAETPLSAHPGAS